MQDRFKDVIEGVCNNFFRSVSIVFSCSQGDGTTYLEICVRKNEATISKPKEEYFVSGDK